MLVDLRSDTMTRPTPAMRQAMANAEVGDDQYGEDPTVQTLQEEFAQMMGKEAAVYLPSGTMGNQIGLRLHARPGDGVIAGARQHVVAYELGAGPANAGITWVPIDDTDGTLDAGAVALAASGADYYLTRATAVFIEDTHMAAGGTVWPGAALADLSRVAAEHGLPVHLDGARLWHASVASGQALAERAAVATTVTCCLSKGLGAPVGSVLAGSAAQMADALIERQRFGGSMRQAGVIAAAGLVALRTMIDRLADDHRRAVRLAEAVAERWPGAGLDPASVQTNIVLFRPPDPEGLLKHLAGEGVRAGYVAPGVVRLVTHVDVDEAGIEQACLALAHAPS
jgi:threonine aldolase